MLEVPGMGNAAAGTLRGGFVRDMRQRKTDTMHIPSWHSRFSPSACPTLAAELPEATQGFIDKAAVANRFEIDTSQLALK